MHDSIDFMYSLVIAMSKSSEMRRNQYRYIYIGYIGQFQNEATGTLRTRYRRTKAVSMYLMKILSLFLHLREILICFRIGWFL